MENLLFSGVPKFRQSTASLQCARILGHLTAINFPFETNGKLMILGVPILKLFRISTDSTLSLCYVQKIACAMCEQDNYDQTAHIGRLVRVSFVPEAVCH